MNVAEIISRRLVNQHIAGTEYTKPEEIVSRMVAMQAQEYAMSKWAVGLRLRGVGEAAVEKAFNDGAILRTHLMRPTWHFVVPADIRWLLALTAPRVHAANAFMYRKLELDAAFFKRSNDVLAKALEGNKHLTRSVLQAELERKNIKAEGLRLGYLMMYAELEGLICSGPRQGKQFSYALLEERAPAAGSFDRGEALARLAERYFASRGPATAADFAYWSGLTMKDALEAIETLPARFAREGAYAFLPDAVPALRADQTTFLMPDYDEYGMGYKDRGALFNPDNTPKQLAGGQPVFNRMVILDGRIAGTWQRTAGNKTIAMEIVPFTPFGKQGEQAVENAIERYLSFEGKKRE